MTRTGFPERLRVSHQSRRPTDVRRRNGKLQSCEPCRKAKLRCDHMMPTCGRCARRNKTKECTYHPAPLTKQLPTPTSQTGETEWTCTSPRAVLDHEVASIPQDPHSLPTADVSLLISRANETPAESLDTARNLGVEQFRQRPPPDRLLNSNAFFPSGSDNFVSAYALLTENEGTIGILPESSETISASNVPRSEIDKGALVLSLLKDLPVFDKYIEKLFMFERGSVLIEPMIKMWSGGIWSAWQRVLKTQSPEGLQAMSESVWQHTLSPLTEILHQTTAPREFIAATTGKSLRWEVVGIIFTVVGLLAQTLQDGDPIFCSHQDEPVDRATLVLKMYNASEICLKFCMGFDIMNDLFLWFMYESTVLSSSVHAKGSFYNYQRSGQLYNALLALGLHQEIKVSKNTPFFIAEFRKRLFTNAYANDKYSSAFVGRPPRLTRHYCLIQLPLDLTDSQMMSDGLDLDGALRSLDEDGWNLQQTVQPCTFARIFARDALLTEEILEISLGFMSSDDICQRAADIEDRANKLWTELPSFLKTDGGHSWDLKRAPIELLFLAYIRLSHLGHHFLLQRTLIKKIGADSTKLLAVARETFDFVLLAVNHRDLLRDFQVDFTQLLIVYGIPAAAVVGVELLHQEHDPSSVSANTNKLPRSDTIQSLSVFVACLASLRQERGNHVICERGRKFLKKIIDTILEPIPAVAIGNESSTELDDSQDPSLATPIFQTGTDGEFVRWLESMEWDQEKWVDFT